MKIKYFPLFTMIPFFMINSCQQQLTPADLNGVICGNNLVLNSSFEDPVTVVDQAFLPQVTSWNIDLGGNIEINKTWVAAQGKQSIDINPLTLGAISQNIRTKVGQAYKLSFSIAGNPDSLSTKKIEVTWGNNSLGLFEFVNDLTTTKANMKWQTRTVDIPANLTTTEITKLGFLSGNPGAEGAVIDNISVTCN